jgi:hypothetical protein
MLFCNFVQNRLDFDKFLTDIRCYGFIDTLKMLRALFKYKHVSELPTDSATSRISFALGVCYSTFCGKSGLENAHDALVDSIALFDVYNAENVCKLFDIMSLFQHVVSRTKAVKWIKQTAGISFQQKLEHIKNAPIAEHKQNVVADTWVSPTWEEEKYQQSSTVQRLCLNCMQFYDTEQHLQCRFIAKSCLKA